MLLDKNDIELIDSNQPDTSIAQWMPETLDFKDYDRQIDKATFLFMSTKWSEITSEAQFKDLLNLHAYLKTLDDRIESYRKKLIEPFRREVNETNAKAKELTSRLDDLLQTCKHSLQVYCDKQEGEDKFKSFVTEKCSIKVKEIYNFEMVDFDLIPREYLMVDGDKIHMLIKAGIRIIPGLKINKINDLTLRRK